VELEEIFSYVRQRSETDAPEFEQSYISGLETFSRSYRRLYPMCRIFETLSSFALRPGHTDVLFFGTKFSDLIDLLRLEFVRVTVLVHGQRDLLNCLKKRLPMIIGWRWSAGLLQSYRLGAHFPTNPKLRSTILDIQDTLARAQPKVIVLDNDSLPLQRAVLYAARQLQIPVATIQHGIFMESADPRIMDGYYTDYMLVWGRFFKDLYLRRGILPDRKVHVLGYPYRVAMPKPISRRTKQPGVCFLGQPWEDYDEHLREPKRRIILSVIRACRCFGLPLVYRPHPTESRALLLDEHSDLKLTPRGESLGETIASHECFVSINSTALVEAALRGKIAVQIRDEAFSVDNFEELGVSYSLKSDESIVHEFFREVYRGAIESVPVSDDYVNVSMSPVEMLRQLLPGNAKEFH
jgi:hypothetical protein